MIVQIGDPVLREIAKPVAKKDIGSSKLRALITRMSKDLASEENGVAIAAPQVGASLRLFVVAGRVFKNDEEDETPANRVYINPELTRLSRAKKEMSEGCLSVRGTYGSVVRHEKVSLKALDDEGKPLVHHASGLLAHIFQHEIDHLDGVLYVDKAISVEESEEVVPSR